VYCVEVLKERKKELLKEKMHISKAPELIALLSTMSLGVFHLFPNFFLYSFLSLSMSYPLEKIGEIQSHSTLFTNLRSISISLGHMILETNRKNVVIGYSDILILLIE
jgi:hypothetical protein